MVMVPMREHIVVSIVSLIKKVSGEDSHMKWMEMLVGNLKLNS